MSRDTDSGLDRVSGYFYGTTKDIIRISNVSEAEFGENINMKFSNLSNGTGKLTVKVGNVEVCTRNDLTSSYVLIFTQNELSNLIKLLKNEETEITYIVTTNEQYTASATSIIILKGCIYIKKNGTWVRAKLHKKDESWKATKAFIKVSGTWRSTR